MAQENINAYNERAIEYEERWSSYLAHTHSRFLEWIEVEKEDYLLDVSGGTGLLAREIADQDRPFLQLVVNDPSQGMLSIAKSRLPDDQPIAFSNFRADRLGFEKNTFDRIFCLNAFHFYINQQQTLDILYHILKPGGKLYLLDWDRSGFFGPVNRLIDWLTSEYINTRSLQEMKTMLNTSYFTIARNKNWRWRYWKFFFLEAKK